MSTVKHECPQCRQLMAIVPEYLGRLVRCPHCQHVLTAPAASHSGPLDDAEAPAATLPFPAPSEVPPNPFAELAEGNRPPSLSPATAIANSPETFAQSSLAGSPRSATESSVRPSAPNQRRANDWLLALAVPYAALMTIVAVYYFYQYRSAARLHPLELIPDVFGEYKNTTTKGHSQVLHLPPPDAELPPHLHTGLGTAITVGQIEVTPLKIEQRPLVACREGAGKEGRQTIKASKDSLFLHVRLRNISTDVSFHPTDPFYVRRPRDKSDRPYALIEVGSAKFYGGALEYQAERDQSVREWIAGQEGDDQPLKPGEARESILVTHPSEPVIAAVRKHNGGSVWRVHVRRGLTTFRDQEIAVSAVIGVPFSAADIRRPGW